MSIISLFILELRLWLSCRVQLWPIVVHCFIFIKRLYSSSKLLHCFDTHSHSIFPINKHKDNWVFWFDSYNYTRQIPLVKPCAKRYFYQTLTDHQVIRSVFISDYFELQIDHKFTKRGVVYLFMPVLIHISS